MRAKPSVPTGRWPDGSLACRSTRETVNQIGILKLQGGFVLLPVGFVLLSFGLPGTCSSFSFPFLPFGMGMSHLRLCPMVPGVAWCVWLHRLLARAPASLRSDLNTEIILWTLDFGVEA